MRKVFIFGLGWVLLSNQLGNIKNSPQEFLGELKNNFNEKNLLWNPELSTDYLSKFNLCENFILENNKIMNITIPPKSLLNIQNSLTDFSPTKVTSITYPNLGPIEFQKFAYILNETNNPSKVSIFVDENKILNVETDFSKIRNGPFLAYPNNGKINVKSFYGKFDVIPMKFSSKSSEDNEEIEFVNEKNYPPYFVSKRLTKKDSLTSEDAVWILDSYKNLYGDYFKVNHKSLVCTDAAMLLIKTSGINLEKELLKNKISGNEYIQRNISSLMGLTEKNGRNLNTFHKGNLEKILNEGEYGNLNPHNFGIKSFSPGQVIIFSRFYNSGPLKGRIQKKFVHLSVISKTDGKKIIETSSVSSQTTKPPYDKNIMLGFTDFEDWYIGRSDYRGSDETNESLTYRIYGVVDWVDVINKIKRK